MATIQTNYRVINNQAVKLEDIPKYDYGIFRESMISLLSQPENHCVNYFAFKVKNEIQFIACVANDAAGDICLLSFSLPDSASHVLPSLTANIAAMHIFEREIHENFGIEFSGHPWLKPVRFAHGRANQDTSINDYPFYTVESEELHEVGVGPVHAGIIEPGHFRFICNGENVLHLEIQLGWQHRGMEDLFCKKDTFLQRNILAENIAGDSVIGHTTAYAALMEAMSGVEVSGQLHAERALALELERIAVHVGDISALCTDVAYLLGANVFSVLRTSIINLMQLWCGNRFGKSLIRTGGTYFSFTEGLKLKLNEVLNDFEKRFDEIASIAYHLPGIENRFDGIGTITQNQARLIGAVGMAARMTNVRRDIRETHPLGAYKKYPVKAITLSGGDVFSRFLLRRKEIKASIQWIRELLKNTHFNESPNGKPKYNLKLQANTFAISLTEGWRGEICHCAITGPDGELQHYKIKDPSMHNWKSLELSLRNLEISDFPINNKSYNLSYCGHDL